MSMSQPISLKDVAQNKARRSEAKPDNGTDKPQSTEPTAPAKEPPAAAEPEIDYKTKFSESSKEAQRFMDLLKEHGIDPKTGKRAETPAPQPKEEPTTAPTREVTPSAEAPQLSDKALASIFPGFDTMTEEQKDIIRRSQDHAKHIAKMDELLAEIQDERVFNKEFNKIVKQEKWKTLRDFDEEFHEFAYKPENLKTPLEVLAAAFLHGKGQSSTSDTPAEPAPKGVEPGTHGPRGGAPSDDGLSADEVAELRKTDPRAYNKLVRTGKLKMRDDS